MNFWFVFKIVLVVSVFLPLVQSVDCVWDGCNLSPLGELSYSSGDFLYFIKFCGVPSKCTDSMACQVLYDNEHLELIHNETDMHLLSNAGGEIIFRAFGSSPGCSSPRSTIVNITSNAVQFYVLEYSKCHYLMIVPLPPSLWGSICSTPANGGLSTTNLFLITFCCVIGIFIVTFAIAHYYKKRSISAMTLPTYHSIGGENTIPYYSALQQQRMKNCCVTARIRPGKNFLNIIPKCNDISPNAIITSLTHYADSHRPPLDNTVAVLFQEKMEDLIEEGHSPEKSLSLALLWLYTNECWVYQEINKLLRADSSLMKQLAPCIYGLILSFKHMDEQYLYSGTVYRRTRLTDKEMDFYHPGSTFVWSSFLSTSTEFSEDITFGDVLFVISIGENHTFYAISLQDISAVPLEKEVLLLPNAGYIVTSMKKGTDVDYPNVKVLFEVELKYVCVS